jgi:hypothetical protein
MFFDTGPLGPGWGESPQPTCKSCQQPILAHHRTENVQFPASADSAAMSGAYHVECARPFASIARALDMLGRFPFGR